MRKFFVSDRIGAERLSNDNSAVVFGKAHYSWKIISNLYQRALHNVGAEVISISRPEVYQTDVALSTIFATAKDMHLAVKPIEELRPMPGIKNLFVCGWEFPEISQTDYGISPFYNQFRILNGADAVLCWSDFTRDNLRKVGIDKSVTLPPPVTDQQITSVPAIPALPCLALDTSSASGQENVFLLDDLFRSFKNGKVFVSVLNPFDERKRLIALLNGFQAAIDAGANIYLVIKLVIDNIATTTGNINEILRTRYNYEATSKRIFFVGSQFSDTEMRSLFSAADFYVCTSSCEGLNLPLVGAMRQGKPIVSTWNSAMGTYLDQKSSIEIECETETLTGRGHSLATYMPVTHFPPKDGAVGRAILEAYQLSQISYNEIASGALKAAEENFGLPRFASRLESLINSINQD